MHGDRDDQRALTGEVERAEGVMHSAQCIGEANITRVARHVNIPERSASAAASATEGLRLLPPSMDESRSPTALRATVRPGARKYRTLSLPLEHHRVLPTAAQPSSTNTPSGAKRPKSFGVGIVANFEAKDEN